MRKLIFTTIIIAFAGLISCQGQGPQTKQLSHSAALRLAGKNTVDLFNGLRITVEFDTAKQNIHLTGEALGNKMIIREYMPLDNPEGQRLEIGKSYNFDNLYASIEIKILEITDNKVIRIWYRIAAKTDELPKKGWI